MTTPDSRTAGARLGEKGIGTNSAAIRQESAARRRQGPLATV